MLGIVLADLGATWLTPGHWLWFALPGGWLLGSTRWAGPALLSLVLSVFGFVHALALSQAELFPASRQLGEGRVVAGLAEGVVVSEPRWLGKDKRRTSCLVRLESIKAGGLRHGCRQVLPALLAEVPPNLAYGDRVRALGTLEPLRTGRNPGEFSASAFYARSTGAPARLVVGRGGDLSVVERDAASPLVGWALRLRDRFAPVFSLGLEARPDAAGVIRSMALGYRDETPPEIEEGFRLSGTLHIFAVSGLHVVIIAQVLHLLLGACGLSKRRASLVTIPLLFGYAVLTGLAPSALRAAVMSAILLAGPLFERSTRVFNSLALSALVLLGWDTRELFAPGFQLSFVVVGFIAALGGWFSRPLERRLRHDPFIPRVLLGWRRRVENWCGRKFAGLVGVSTAAWLGSVPLLVWHFQTVTPVGLVANWLLVPLSSLILWGAAITLLVHQVGLGLPALAVNWLNGWLAQAAIVSSAWFGGLPGASLTYAPGAQVLEPQGCQLVIIDTSDGGGAVLVRVKDSAGATRHWLIDSGSERAFALHVEPVLRAYGVNALDGLILTHRDARHDGAALRILQRHRPTRLWMGPHTGRKSAVRDALLTAAAASGTTVGELHRGMSLTLGDAAALRCLHPGPDPDRLRGVGDDDALVLRLEAQGWRVLLTSDAGFSTEKALLAPQAGGEERPLIQADLLVKGWHGGDFSGLVEFVTESGPRAVVATHHRFPRREQIPEGWRLGLEARGVRVFGQGETGGVTVDLTPTELRAAPFLPGGGAPLVVARRPEP